MRRLLTFECEGAQLGASLDPAQTADGAGLLMVTGGSQTRIGSHRMYERLAASLAMRGVTSLRFDRRGVGDSDGQDPGFRGSGPDIAAAAAVLRVLCPELKRLYGFGLCDGATALAQFAGEARLDGLILVNPWLVEAASGEPAPAAIRSHYRGRLLSPSAWGRFLSGKVDYRKLLRGAGRIAGRHHTSPLALETAVALEWHGRPVELILARGDATAIAAAREWQAPAFARLEAGRQDLDSDSHTFAREGDDKLLAGAVIEAIRRLDRQAEGRRQ